MKTLTKYKRVLLEALIYFSSSVKYPTKMMMYKMLAQFDYRHYKETGLPATSLEYETWERGDVPTEFHKEISIGDDVVLPDFMRGSLNVSKETFENEDGKICKEFGFHPAKGRKPNLKVFTPRQQKILKEVVDIYQNVPAWMASKASHEPNTPWKRTMNTEGLNKPIDLIKYADLDKSIDLELTKDKLIEMRALISNYGE
ncbi:MAG: type II toxin-antitoxin system antitoxin SocA domain-containing protein [Bacteroidota bacterium]